MIKQVPKDMIPAELANSRPSVNAGDLILIVEGMDGAGKVDEVVRLTSFGTPETRQGHLPFAWAKLNEPVNEGDQVLVLRSAFGAGVFRGEVAGTYGASVAYTLPLRPYALLLRPHAGHRYPVAWKWVKIPTPAKEDPVPDFRVHRAGEQEPKASKAPFAVGDWVRDTSDGGRIGKITKDVSEYYLGVFPDAHENEFGGAFLVDFVDGKPMRFVCVWARDLEKVDVNPGIKLGEDFTVLEWLCPSDEKPALPFMGARTYSSAAPMHGCIAVRDAKGAPWFAKTWTLPEGKAAEAESFKAGDLVSINAKCATSVLPEGTLMQVVQVDRRGELGLVALGGENSGNYGRPLGRGVCHRSPDEVTRHTEEISVGDKVVLTEKALKTTFDPGLTGLTGVVGGVTKHGFYYHVTIGGGPPSFFLKRDEIQKWSPSREAAARKKLNALKAEADEAEARASLLEKLKDATVILVGSYIYTSDEGSEVWTLREPKPLFGCTSYVVVAVADGLGKEIEIIK